MKKAVLSPVGFGLYVRKVTFNCYSLRLLRENKRSSLDTSNLQQDEITELKKDLEKNKQANRELQTALDNSKSLYDQAMSEIVFLRGTK